MKTIMLLLISLFFCCNSFAEIRRICKVKYQEEDEAWSKEYTMEVEFVTGSELNKKTSTYDYEAYTKYCLVWFGKGQVAILKISEYVSTGSDGFDEDAFKSLFSYRREIECEQINDPNSKKWNIMAKNYSGFIDPREND